MAYPIVYSAGPGILKAAYQGVVGFAMPHVGHSRSSMFSAEVMPVVEKICNWDESYTSPFESEGYETVCLELATY